MHRIDNESASTVMPEPGVTGPVPNGYFVQRASGVSGTTVTSDVLNAWQEEVCNVIEGVGIALNKALQNQLYAAVVEMIERGPSDSGLGKVEDDMNPHLGGNLNLNDFEISSLSNGDITIQADTYIGGDGVTALIEDKFAGGVGVGAFGALLDFGTDSIEFRVNNNFGGAGYSTANINASGMQLNGSGARISTILNENDMVSNSATALTTQTAYRAYLNARLARNAQMLISYCGAVAGGTGLYGWGRRAGFGDKLDNGGSSEQFMPGWVAPRAGTLKGLRVWAKRWDANGSSIPITYTVQVYTKSGSNLPVPTSLMVTDTRVGSLGEIITLSNLTDEVSVSAGTVISLYVRIAVAGVTTDQYQGSASMLFL